MLFTKITNVVLPQTAETGKGFPVIMETDGEVPFAQIIVRHTDGWEWVVRGKCVTDLGNGRYQIDIPSDAYHSGTAYLQVEGCCRADIEKAAPRDWIIQHRQLEVQQGKPIVSQPQPKVETPALDLSATPKASLVKSREPIIYFGIHKHMHQPYYHSTDLDYWGGEKDAIFGQRAGAYRHFIPAAIRNYIEGGLAHAGLSTSWSGSLIEQLHRCAETGRANGAFRDWNRELRQIAQSKTAFGNPRVDFTAFGFFHPLMPLIPARDIVGQIAWHRAIIKETFGVDASDVLFPPETAFHPHIIPALLEAGVNAVIYDSIHHFRTCVGYPYAGPSEGMLPPNKADQVNPPTDDWLQLNTIWAPSKISPKLLKPCYLSYQDHAGKEYRIIGVPAERYLGNEDARGGYGALQYEMVMGQIYDQIVHSGTYDPDHPPFFLLHSDGDNHGGGADSYYTCNTARLVEMCKTERRFQLITIKDYLHQFPVDPKNVVHLEPGSWAGADNGDPQFTKWFSWVEKDYSPDLNSWAVLTAFQHLVHSLEDAGEDAQLINALQRLLYTAETSCYWYWTGQTIWDAQVTMAANKGVRMAEEALTRLLKSKKDTNGPTIFVPWVRPANPGGKDWGQGGLKNAEPDATFSTFVYDIAGVKKVTLHYRETDSQTEQEIDMKDCGSYPSRTDALVIATLYKAVLPAGTGKISYYVEAVDLRGNVSYSPVGRIFIA